MAGVITRDDLIRAGACASGVAEWCERHAPLLTAIPVDVAIRLSTEEEADKIRRALQLDGNGNGNGNGNGDGNGDGYGYGNGDGDGYGNGNGYGYGNGNGCGYG